MIHFKGNFIQVQDKMILFRGRPIFGKDSNPQNTSNFFGLAGTVIFWFLFLIVSLFIKAPQKKPKFKEVQIVLSSTPVQKKSAESPAPAAPAAAPAQKADASKEIKAEQAPAKAAAQPKKVEQPKTTAKPKTQPAASKPAEPKKSATAKKTPAPAPVVEQTYAVDPMEAFNQQVSKKPKQEFDWSMFDDEPAETSSTSQTRTVQPVENSFSGSAGTAASSTANQRQTSTSSKSSASQNAVSTSTSSALGKISDTTYTGRAVAGIQSESSVKTAASGSGKVMMEMADGSQRALLEPSQPVINLSEKAAATIDGSKKVTITFTVVKSGNVPYGEIEVTPASILSQAVKDEIFLQISKWRFEAADYSSTAKFEYRIVKK